MDKDTERIIQHEGGGRLVRQGRVRPLKGYSRSILQKAD